MNNIFKKILSEEKKYYLFILIILFVIIFFQFLLYPKIVQHNLNKKLAKKFQNKIQYYRNKTSEQLIKQQSYEIKFKKISSLLASTSTIPEHMQSIITMSDSYDAVVKDISIETPIKSSLLKKHPVIIKLIINNNKLPNLLNDILNLSFSLRISNLKISRLSKNKIFATIQVIFKEIKL